MVRLCTEPDPAREAHMKILNIVAAVALALSAAGASTAATPASHSKQREWNDLDRAGPHGPDYAQRDRDRRAGMAGRQWASAHPRHGKHKGWNKHHRCHTEWRHHHKVRICR